MSEDSEVIRVPLSLQACDGGEVALTFGPMPPEQLLDAIAQLESVEGQVSFHRQLVEGLHRAKEEGAI